MSYVEPSIRRAQCIQKNNINITIAGRLQAHLRQQTPGTSLFWLFIKIFSYTIQVYIYIYMGINVLLLVMISVRHRYSVSCDRNSVHQ